MTGVTLRRIGGPILLLLVLALVGYGAQRLALFSWDAIVKYSSPFATPLPPGAAGAPLAQRVVLVVVDGLREDASRSMPALNGLRARGAEFVAWTGEPSLSLPGWTVIVSGAGQEVSGVTTNWFAGPATVDHLFAAARRAGLRTAVAGSPGWGQLFGRFIDERVMVEDPEYYPTADPLYQTSADVYAGAVEMLRRGEAGLVLVHFPSVDLLGHGFGGASPQYAEAVARVDRHLAGLLERVDLSTTAVVVTSDHGHVDRGGHGGWEPVVKRVPLVLAGAGVRRNVQGPDVRQADVAPTVAALLGLSIPAHNQGRPLVEALEGETAGVERRWAEQQAAFYGMVAGYLGTPGLAEAVSEARSAGLGRGIPDAVPAFADDVAMQAYRARTDRLSVERMRRLPVALAVVVIPALYLLVHPRRRLLPAAAGAAVFFIIDYALFFGRGDTFSLSVFNTESGILAFFNRRLLDAVIAIAGGALVAGLLAARRTAGDAARAGIDTGVVAAYALVIQVAYFYWLWDVRFVWYLPDLRLGFKYYLDLLALVPVGLLAVGYMLVAVLGRWVGRMGLRDGA